MAVAWPPRPAAEAATVAAEAVAATYVVAAGRVPVATIADGALDPTVDAVKEPCLRMLEVAKSEWVLLNYNGHIMPQFTADGNI